MNIFQAAQELVFKRESLTSSKSEVWQRFCRSSIRNYENTLVALANRIIAERTRELSAQDGAL